MRPSVSKKLAAFEVPPKTRRWAVSPWGARGWSQFCFAKLLLAHAFWIAAESPQTPQGSRTWSEKPGFFRFAEKNAHRFS
jgi:hypothetical protein